MAMSTTLLDNDELIKNINLIKESSTVKDFHKLYYEADHTWNLNKYRGFPILKFCTDLWQYQELITIIRPNLIIECGTAFGGSALYFSDLQKTNNIKPSKIITIDVEAYKNRPINKYIEYIKGSSTDPKIVKYVTKESKKYKEVMVVLDSCHAAQHVYDELNIYSKIVTKHSYVIVEDSNLGNLVMTDVKDLLGKEVGPAAAIKTFLKENNNFVSDVICERQLLTTNIGGYLFKVE